MTNPERLRRIAENAVRFAEKQKIDQAQVSAFLEDSALTRFANSQVHQNVAQKSGGVRIKAVLGKKIGTIQVDTLERKEVEKAVLQALKLARASSPNNDFKSLPAPEKWKPIAGAFDEATSMSDPMVRAEKVKEAIEAAHAKSPKVRAVAGYFSSGASSFAVANSLGVSGWAEVSFAYMKTTVISKSGASEGSGTAEKHSRKIGDIKPSVIAKDAADKAVKGLNPVKVEPAEYEVVLSPLAVSTLLMYVCFMGFSATTYQDGQSFVKYVLNKQAFDKKLNVKDDARDTKTMLAVPVDGEGVPKKLLKLIYGGVVSEASIVHNSFTAGKENKKSTGHTPPPIGDFWGDRPMPFNVAMQAGDSSLDEAIADTKHGLFVNTVHYVNPVEPARAVLTGLTRDGTFLIKNGELSKPVVNLRFTDSMLSSLKDMPLIGSKVETVRNLSVPMAKLKKLRFVGLSAY